MMSENLAPAFVRPKPDTRLAHLAARYDDLKALVDRAKADLEELTTAIKSEMAAAAGHAAGPVIVLDTPDLQRPLRLTAVESWRIDATRLKVDDPATYVRWARKSTSLKLERVRG